MSDIFREIDHFVVLTLENRSFDHMLGYLSLEAGRKDVDGLDGSQFNTYKGVQYNSAPSPTTVVDPDPLHDWADVQMQLHNDNGGFIENYATKAPQPERIMHYHRANQVPAFDHLAREFCICDRWFCSVPGATQPNRIYSLAGESAGKKNNLSVGQLILGWNVRPIFEFLPKDVTWRYYSHDIASLRYVRGYQTNVDEIDKISSFYQAVADGTLPNVSWIDPNFGILSGIYSGPPNDDHPPHDIHHGQNLVRKIYNALLAGPRAQWNKTVFIIIYDEHGGFYDHVPPGKWTPADDRAEFRVYGPRVPAIIVSPWAKKRSAVGSVQDIVFDHTSILKSILLRFCKAEDSSIPPMTGRVAGANDLSHMLTESQPRNDYSPIPALPFNITWEDKFVMVEKMVGDTKEKELRRRRPSELQQGLEALAEISITKGVPPDRL